MLPKNVKRISAQQIAISWFVAFAVTCMAQSAFGGAGGGSIMLSQGPCAFSLQLQKSVSARKRYLVQMSKLVGDGVPHRGPIEDMYGNIKQASFNSEAADEDDLWGLGTAVKSERAELDPFTSDCMACHDGAGAVSVTIDWRNNPSGLRSHKKPGGADHPIGMDYESYAASSGDYKPISGLNPRMIFVNGRVGCLTCHDPLNQERGHLVMSDRGSALCLSCHSK